MSRQITTHQALPMNALNKQLQIEALDDAPIYQVRSPGRRTSIRFHTGDPREGVSGLSVEALLAIAKDRLEDLRSGGDVDPHHETAIAHLGDAMFHLHARTTDRILRGVEGVPAP